MGKIFETVKTTLEELKFHYSIKNECMFNFDVHGENANFNCSIICDDDNEILFVSITLPQKATRKSINRVCRWITDTNYNTVLGAFMMDTGDGEICYRISNTLDCGAVNSDIVKASLITALNCCDTKYPEIVKTIFLEDSGNILS
ncbi:MAG: YbjN domain-containing protein [Bacteroidales bacterium]|nr:YbjN domain-containing protein [Bacteroidales bacterium]